MNENSDTPQRTTTRRERRAPYRVRTKVAFAIAGAAALLFFVSAFGLVTITLPEYGFISIGEGRVAIKLPERPQKEAIQREGPPLAGSVHVGRNWPFAQRFYIGGDPIPIRGGSVLGRWYEPPSPYLFWKPDFSSFPEFLSWPLWMLALAFGTVGVAFRTREIRRWERAGSCPHCGYSLDGLTHDSNAVCPECGGTLDHASIRSGGGG